MNDDIEAPPENPQRINGFAPGDRVSIVNCELAGAYGKVEHASGGCIPKSCVDNCKLVWVDLIKVPEGVEPSIFRGTYMGGDNTFRFLVNEVTHID